MKTTNSEYGYVGYWRVGGHLQTHEFTTKKQFQEMCEDIEVTNGEEGISVKLLFVLEIIGLHVIMPEIAYQMFDIP
jgi:hypothetical protein